MAQPGRPGGVLVENGGALLGRATTLNCASGCTFTLSGGVADISVSGGPGGGAPVDAQYWTGAAHVDLSAEKNLGALATGLVINTAGVPSAYGGTSCTNQFPRSLSASGAATCATVANTDLASAIITVNGETCTLGGSCTIAAGGTGSLLESR
jgi:hypothetical protein